MLKTIIQIKKFITAHPCWSANFTKPFLLFTMVR